MNRILNLTEKGANLPFNKLNSLELRIFIAIICRLEENESISITYADLARLIVYSAHHELRSPLLNTYNHVREMIVANNETSEIFTICCDDSWSFSVSRGPSFYEYIGDGCQMNVSEFMLLPSHTSRLLFLLLLPFNSNTTVTLAIETLLLFFNMKQPGAKYQTRDLIKRVLNPHIPYLRIGTDKYKKLSYVCNTGFHHKYISVTFKW